MHALIPLDLLMYHHRLISTYVVFPNSDQKILVQVPLNAKRAFHPTRLASTI
jgi:hypothetical protein